jgi:hypothetical protein
VESQVKVARLTPGRPLAIAVRVGKVGLHEMDLTGPTPALIQSVINLEALVPFDLQAGGP